MFYAYVIKSINQNYFYKGHCENLEKRFRNIIPESSLL